MAIIFIIFISAFCERKPKFDKKLAKRVKWLVLNKKDLVDRDELEILKTDLQKHFKDEFYIYCISAAKKEGTQTLMRDIGEYMELTND